MDNSSESRLAVRLRNRQAVLASLMHLEPCVRGYPTKLMIEPTSICDLRCPLCPTGSRTLTRTKGVLSLDLFHALIDELDPYLSTLLLWNYGEPFLNPRIFDMIAYSHDRGIRTVCSTNGYPLHIRFPENIVNLLRCGLDHLIVSVDGAKPETHSTYRIGSDLAALIRGLRTLVELKRSEAVNAPLIEVRFLVMRHNEAELMEMHRLARDIGVDRLSIKTVNLSMLDTPRTRDEIIQHQRKLHQLAQVFLPSDPALSRYDARLCQPRGAAVSGCARLWEMPVVQHDGDVVPCCYDVTASMVLGNCLQQSITSIWNSREYQDLRRAVAQSRTIVPLCSVCTDGAPTFLARYDFRRPSARPLLYGVNA